MMLRNFWNAFTFIYSMVDSFNYNLQYTLQLQLHCIDVVSFGDGSV